MSWPRFFLWSFVWLLSGPALAVLFGAHPLDGLIVGAITYVFPLGGMWCCMVMAGILD